MAVRNSTGITEMSIRVELEITEEYTVQPPFVFDMRGTAQAVCRGVLETEACPADVEISLTYVDDDSIHEINREFRGVDRVTDVLSFPNLDFTVPEDDPGEETAGSGSSRVSGTDDADGGGVYCYRSQGGALIRPSDWAGILDSPETKADSMDPENGCLVLGDIVLNLNRVREQAAAYGHSEQREFAFLIAHSMLHLCGYDHMTEEQSRIMFARQEKVLQDLGITRELSDQSEQEDT